MTSTLDLTEQELRHVARLAALELSGEELSQLREDLAQILGYVRQLDSVATDGVPPTSHVHGATNVFRDDIIRDSLSIEDVRALAPDFSHSGFRVPRVL